MSKLETYKRLILLVLSGIGLLFYVGIFYYFWKTNFAPSITTQTSVEYYYRADLLEVGFYGLILFFLSRMYGGMRIGYLRNAEVIFSQVFAILASFVLVTFRYPLLSIFTTEIEVLEVAASTMKIIAPFYILFTFIEIYSSALRGMGDVIIPMIMTMLGVCGFRIAWVIFVVPLEPSMETIASNYPVSWGITAMFFIVYYAVKMRRLGKKLGN